MDDPGGPSIITGALRNRRKLERAKHQKGPLHLCWLADGEVHTEGMAVTSRCSRVAFSRQQAKTEDFGPAVAGNRILPTI